MKKSTLKKLFISFAIISAILLLTTIILIAIMFSGSKSEGGWDQFGWALSWGYILRISYITTGTVGAVTCILTIVFASLYLKVRKQELLKNKEK
ncbi:hypothetical protein N8G13_00665 [Mycoplasma zalophi]|uniref:hypothetical protein n=1 Tax=Mycoplasma zalophi TaxID=191287 RepID=UPI0021CA5248|nr:hypothetical protein [Mycoplasma zalophi]MCU4116975.1 hypothetical protein [Mycoplasma zalophi]